MDKLRRSWKRVPKPIRKTLVLMVGSAVVVAGLIMLITPGPGWAGIFLGFAILATEFAFAERVRDWMIGVLKRLMERGKRAWQKFRQRG